MADKRDWGNSRMGRNGYGWLTTERWGDQRAGFYIDQDDRILFWPQQGKKSEKKGYIIDEDAASEILSHNLLKFEYFFIPLILICVTMGVTALMAKILGERITILDDLLLVIFVLLLGQLCAGLYDRLRHPFKDFPINLDKFERTNIDLPKPEHLKLSAKKGKISFSIFIFSLPIIAAAFGYLSYTAYLEQDISAMVGSGVLACMFFGIPPICLWYEKTGLPLKQVTTYSVHPDFLDKLKNAHSKRNKLHHYLAAQWRFVKAYWGVWIILGILVRGPIYYELYQTPYLNADIITAEYNEHILSKIEKNSKSYLYKWDPQIDLYVGPYADLDFRKELISDFKIRAKLIGLDLRLVSYLANKEGIALTFSNMVRNTKGEHVKLSKPKLSHKDGHIKHFQIRVNPKAFEQSLGGNQLKNNKRRHAYYAFLFYSSLNFYHGLLYTNGFYRDNDLKRITIRRVIAAMQFDRRLKPGMSAKEVGKIIPILAQEIEEAPSFDYWLDNIRQ